MNTINITPSQTAFKARLEINDIKQMQLAPEQAKALQRVAWEIENNCASQNNNRKGISQFFYDIFSSHTVKVNPFDEEAKEKFVKRVKKHSNIGLAISGSVTALGAAFLTSSLIKNSSVLNICLNGLATLVWLFDSSLALYSRIKFMKSPLYKEYKASLPENTSLLKKATKLLRK